MLPGDGRCDLEWVEASGQGVVHSFTLVPQRPPAVDYNVCLVDFAEGPRMMTMLIDVPLDEIVIGLKVSARIVDQETDPSVVFTRAGS